VRIHMSVKTKKVHSTQTGSNLINKQAPIQIEMGVCSLLP
jgi:hypothetical protein